MNVVVTGVAGFIASKLARRLTDEGAHVVGVDDLSTGKESNLPDIAEVVIHDLADPEVLRKLPTRCDAILHLAGQSSGEISFDDPVSDLRKNTVSTINLIRHGIAVSARRMIYASSMSVYGEKPDAPVREGEPCRPLSCYGVSKLSSEHYLRLHARDLPYVAFRMFNVYGPGQDLANLRQGMASIYLAQALDSGRVLVKGSVQRYRDFIMVDDVVHAWMRALTEPAAINKVFNLGTGQRTTVQTVLESLSRLIDGMTWYCEGSTQGDQNGIYADPALLRQTLGVTSFVPLEDGLRQFVEWAREAQGAR